MRGAVTRAPAWRATALLGFALVLGWTAPARAQEDAQVLAARTAASKAHYDLGRNFVRLEKWAEATAEFEEAYRLKPLPILFYNIGQAARRAGQHEKALLAFRHYLEAIPDAPERVEVERWIAQLEAAPGAPQTIQRLPLAPAPPPVRAPATDEATPPANGAPPAAPPPAALSLPPPPAASHVAAAPQPTAPSQPPPDSVHRTRTVVLIALASIFATGLLVAGGVGIAVLSRPEPAPHTPSTLGTWPSTP